MRPRLPQVRLRSVTPGSYVEGGWVKHEPTGRWFEAWEREGDFLLGLDLHDEVLRVPMRECRHAFDKTLDR